MKFILFFILRILLFPFVWILYGIIYTRNWLYDTKLLKSVQPDIFTINVGNLNLGGTGKTPHVEYLVRLLMSQYKLSILSRGYKRKTKGFRIADENVSAKTIGDEPMQYYLKFKDTINVVVSEDRVAGVNQIEASIPDNQLIILDDAFQHRKIAPHLNLLLCDYNRPFYEDYLVPVGKLRDIRQSAIRANAVIVTKCPPIITSATYDSILSGIKRYVSAETPVFFSRIRYKDITGYLPEKVLDSQQKVNSMTGIAKPEVFIQYLTDKGFNLTHSFTFPDHYDFLRKDIDKIIHELGSEENALQIITTEKDMVKIKTLLKEQELAYFFYVPIEIEIENKEQFDAFILKQTAISVSKSI